MPLHLALRLKKLMHDVGDLTPEELFRSVRFYSSSNVWWLEFSHGVMRPGLELPEGYRVMGMHGADPQGLRGIIQSGCMKGSESHPQSYAWRVLGQAQAKRPQASSFFYKKKKQKVATGNNNSCGITVELTAKRLFQTYSNCLGLRDGVLPSERSFNWHRVGPAHLHAAG